MGPSPKRIAKAERRQIKILDQSIGKVAARQRWSKQEEARRTELRLKPDVTALHRHMFGFSQSLHYHYANYH